MQLATLDEQHRPQVRTVVFRGFHQDAQLTMHSDSRSEKNRQLARSTECGICWYFAASREQFRIQSRIEIVTPDMAEHHELITEHWRNLSDAARAQYFAATPGIPFDDSPVSEPSDNSLNQPSPYFSVLIASPYSVDYLNLRTKPQTRLQFALSDKDAWQEDKVNP